MAKIRTVHRCTACGWETPKWSGRCDGCGEWNSLIEELDGPAPSAPSAPPAASPTRIAAVPELGAVARPTGLAEVDRVLGGGLVPGSVTLVGGEPGIGKSTLLLQLAGAIADTGSVSLYVSGEESAGASRAPRHRRW